MVRLLAASFDEKIDFVLESIGITFCQIGGDPVPRRELSHFSGFRVTLRPDLGAEHFVNTSTGTAAATTHWLRMRGRQAALNLACSINWSGFYATA